MSKIGIFFGTDTGRTRLVAKQIARKIGEAAATPVNIGRASLEEFAAYDALILGTPTLGDGELPGQSTGLSQPSWEEFLPHLGKLDMAGKRVAIFGLGDQKKYPNEFVDGIALIHDAMSARGARIVGRWPTLGYEFATSMAVSGRDFLGLALDQINQPVLTDERIDRWLERILPELLR